METLKNMEAVQQAMEYLKQDDARTLREQLELCAIPAPSHMEEKRAAYMLEKMREAGLEDVHTDEAGNVLGTVRGTGNGPGLLLAAHMDTVFLPDTDLTVKREGDRYLCPGINDDTRGLAEILSIARAMTSLNIRGNGDIVFCANVCEEGLGDLKGVKHLFAKPDAYDGFVSIDGTVPGEMVYGATGSNRFRITFRGPGGHSFGAFGIPNPIHAMGRAISAIADLQVKKEPKTTFNVGVVEGGTSVNSIPGECSMLVDLRSNSEEELELLTKRLLCIVEEAAEEENARWTVPERETAASREPVKKVTAHIRQMGQRPAGQQPEDSLIVRAAHDASLAVGITPEYRRAASTDANIPISLGIPALTLGQGGRGGSTHTLQEWYEPCEACKGPQRTLLLMLALAGYGDFKKYQLPVRD